MRKDLQLLNRDTKPYTISRRYNNTIIKETSRSYKNHMLRILSTKKDNNNNNNRRLRLNNKLPYILRRIDMNIVKNYSFHFFIMENDWYKLSITISLLNHL